MHDDPTRVMGQPDPDGGRPRGNMRLLVAGLIAVIVGLLIAIFVIAGGDGDDGETATSAPTELTTETTGPETTETTEPETTETTAPTTETQPTTPTTTEEPTTPEEDGSGGIEAP